MIMLLALAASITTVPNVVTPDLEARGKIAMTVGLCNHTGYAKDSDAIKLITNGLTPFQLGYVTQLNKLGLKNSKHSGINPIDCRAVLHDYVKAWVNLKE